MMSKAQDLGISLHEAIASLRNELRIAESAGSTESIHLPITKMTVQLQLIANKSVDGTAGFSVPVVGAHLGGGASWEREHMQTVVVEFGAPLDQDGTPVKVASIGTEPKA